MKYYWFIEEILNIIIEEKLSKFHKKWHCKNNFNKCNSNFIW